MQPAADDDLRPPPGRLRCPALAHPATHVAPQLLGARFVHASDGVRVAVRITEVEAYMGEQDPGSHAFRGRTPRTEVMFGAAGRLYVYFSYGMHWCANVVCGPEGTASAVLLRAGEVVEGLDVARSRRPGARRDDDLARGPARLTGALGVDGRHRGVDLCDPAGTLWLEPPRQPVPAAAVRNGPRVGVAGPGGDGTAFPWRFWLDGEPTVSAYRPGSPRRRRPAGDETLPTGTPPTRAAGAAPDERTPGP